MFSFDVPLTPTTISSASSSLLSVISPADFFTPPLILSTFLGINTVLTESFTSASASFDVPKI
jgi:hypothetical protein